MMVGIRISIYKRNHKWRNILRFSLQNKLSFLWNCVNTMIGIQITFWMNLNNWVIALMMKLKVLILHSQAFFSLLPRYRHSQNYDFYSKTSIINPQKRKRNYFLFMKFPFELLNINPQVTSNSKSQLDKEKSNVLLLFYLIVRTWMMDFSFT